jgi:hypothetical protein
MLLVVARVRVELPDVVMEVGVKVGETPIGRPAVTAKFTVPVKPLSAVTAAV